MAEPRPYGMPFVDYSTSEDTIATDTTAQSEDKESYACEKILCEIVDETDNKPRYLVKWVGYPLYRATYEPVDSFLDSGTLVEWEKTKKEIASGRIEEFSPDMFEKACWENYEKVQERQARRKAKRDLRERKAAKHESSDDDEPPSKSNTRKKNTSQNLPAKKGTARPVVKKKSKVIEDSEDSDTSSDEPLPRKRSAPNLQPNLIQNPPVAQYGAPVADMGGSTGPSARAIVESRAIQSPAAPIPRPKSDASTAAERVTASAPAAPASTAPQQQGRIAGIGAQASYKAQGASTTPANKPAPMARKSHQTADRRRRDEATPRKRSSLGGAGGAQTYENHSTLFRTGSQLWRAEQKAKLNQAAPDPDMLPSWDPATGKWTPAKIQPARDTGRQFPSAYDRRSPPSIDRPLATERQQSPARRTPPPPPPPPPPPAPRAVSFKQMRTCISWQKGRCQSGAAACKAVHSKKPFKEVTCEHWKKRLGCNRADDEFRFAHHDTGVYSIGQLCAGWLSTSMAAAESAPYVSGGGAPNQRAQHIATAPSSPPPAAAASAPPPRLASQLDSLIGGITAAPGVFNGGGANQATQSGVTDATYVPPPPPVGSPQITTPYGGMQPTSYAFGSGDVCPTTEFDTSSNYPPPPPPVGSRPRGIPYGGRRPTSYGFGGSATNRPTAFGVSASASVLPPPPPAAAVRTPGASLSSQRGVHNGDIEPAPFVFGGGATNQTTPVNTSTTTTVPQQQPSASAVGAQPAATTSSPAFEYPASGPAFTPNRHYSKHGSQWAPAIWGKCPVVDKPPRPAGFFTEEEQDAQIRSLNIKYFEGPFSYGQPIPKKEALLMYSLNSKYHMSGLATWFSGGGYKVTVVSDREPYKTTWLKWFENRTSGIVVLDPDWDMDDLPKLGRYLEGTSVAFFNVGICTGINIKKADLPLKRGQTQPQPEGVEHYDTYGAHHIYPGGDITLITDSIFAHHAVVARDIINKFHEMEVAKQGVGSISKIATRMEVHRYLDNLIAAIVEREKHLTRPTDEGWAQVMLHADFCEKICKIPEDMEQIWCIPHGEEEARHIMIPKKSSNLHYAMPHEWMTGRYNFPTDFVKEPCDETEQARRLILWFSTYIALNKISHRKFYCIVTPEQSKDKRLIDCMVKHAACVQMMTPEAWMERMDKTLRDKAAARTERKNAEAAKAKAKEEAALRAAGVSGGLAGGGGGGGAAGGTGGSSRPGSAGRQ